MTNSKAPAQSEVRPSYRPDIDGLRAVAIIAVVLYHASAGLLPGGFIGVDIFFVISGFLISSLIFKELDQGHFRFGDFYIRRIRRIFPALILMMSAVWVLGLFLSTGPEFSRLGEAILAGGAFVSNLLQWRSIGYFEIDAQLKPLMHLWSLGIEEQFYIVWPVIVVLLWRRRFLTVTFCVVLGSFAFNIWCMPNHVIAAFYLPFGRAWELLLGGVLAWGQRFSPPAIASREVGSTQMRLRIFAQEHSIVLKNLFAVLAFLLLAVGLIAINSDSQFPGWWVLLPVFATLFLIWAGEACWINKNILAHPALVFIGLISYPLYIWHWPLLSILRIVTNGRPSPGQVFVAVLAAILLAIMTWWLVELPLRYSQYARGRIVAVLSAAMVIISALGALSYAHVIQTPSMAMDDALAVEAAKHTYPRWNCSQIMAANVPGYDNCRIWVDPNLKKTFVLWGDSFAGSWEPGAGALAKQNGARLVQFMYSGCPPLVGVREMTRDFWSQECDNFALEDSVVQTISSLHPSLIILVGRWGHYVDGFFGRGQYITAHSKGDPTDETSHTALQEKLPETLRRLARISRVLVIEAVPTLHEGTEAGLARDPNGFEPTLAEYRAAEAFPNGLIEKAAHDIAGITVLDPADVLCDQEKCHAILNGKKLYMAEDPSHLADESSMLFLPKLDTLVKSRR